MQSLVDKWFVTLNIEPEMSAEEGEGPSANICITFVHSKDYLKDFSFRSTLKNADLYNLDYWYGLSFSGPSGRGNLGYFVKRNLSKKGGVDWYSKKGRFYK